MSLDKNKTHLLSHRSDRGKKDYHAKVYKEGRMKKDFHWHYISHKKWFISHFDIIISFQVHQNHPLAPWKAEASSVLLGSGSINASEQKRSALTCTEQNQRYEHLHIGERNWSIFCSYPVCKKVRFASKQD